MNGFRTKLHIHARSLAALALTACSAIALTACGSGSQTSADAVAAATKTWSGAQYSAMGDSYTASPRIRPQTAKQTPKGCGQSESNYPHLVAKMIRSKFFTDLSCTSAKVVNLYQPQKVPGGVNFAQGASLKPSTELVTLGIGGNDIPLTQLLTYCIAQASPDQPCDAPSVVQQAGGSFEDAFVQLQAVLPDVFSGIRKRSPKAKIVLVGYPKILPDNDAGCVKKVYISATGMTYIDQQIQKLNSVLKTAAQKNGGYFVDTYGPSVGHDACQSAGKRWVEPIRAASDAEPFHPNPRGQSNFSLLVMAELAKIKR